MNLSEGRTLLTLAQRGRTTWAVSLWKSAVNWFSVGTVLETSGVHHQDGILSPCFQTFFFSNSMPFPILSLAEPTCLISLIVTRRIFVVLL